MWISLLRLPAGTTSNSPLISSIGSADPQLLQKHFPCRVAGRLNCLMLLAPESHFIVAVEENRLAA